MANSESGDIVKTVCRYVTLPTMDSDDSDTTSGLVFYNEGESPYPIFQGNLHIEDVQHDLGRWMLTIENYSAISDKLQPFYVRLRDWANGERLLDVPESIGEVLPAYLREFPDYDNCVLFESVRDELAPLGLVDSSWHNDSCPSLVAQVSDETYLQVHIDYKARELREYPALITTNFVCWQGYGMDGVECADFVDRFEMVAFIKNKLYELESE